MGKNASQDEIKRAYRELAMKYHPDRNKDKDAEAKFKEINEAYAVLGDEQKRKQYDTYGPSGFGQRFSEEDIFKGFNFEDIFKQMQDNVFGFSGMGGQFGDMFNEAEQTGVNINLQFSDMEKGFDRTFEVKHYKTCSNCRGSGGEPGSRQIKCESCNGTGRRRMQQNSILGRFEMITTCNRCSGRGKIFESACKVCRGHGRVIATEKFRIRAESVDSAGKEEKDGNASGGGRKRFGFM